MALCLVTGGAGFIGSHLVDSLVAHGHRVRVLDDLTTGDLSNLAQVGSVIDFIRADVTDLGAVRAACRGVELAFHHAALASVPRSIADPLATHQACATGTLHVLMAAREAQVRRVIYAASSSAYGAGDARPRRESDCVQPLSPYAVAKLCGEEYCSAFTTVYALETVRLRYFNIFGPRQPPGSPYAAVIPLFIEAMLAGRSPTIYGDGLQSRDFAYVADVVQANLLAAQAPGVAGKVFNIASGRRTTLLELVGHLNDILGTDIKPVHAEPRSGDVRHSQADIARAQTALGFHPHTHIKEDLRRCIDAYRGRLEQRPGPAEGSAPAGA